MPSISEKLKSLGVNLGTEGITHPTKDPKYPIERVIDGREVNTPFGQTFVVENTYPLDPRSESIPLYFHDSLTAIATWLQEPEISNYPAEAFAFIDTETSGLAGGTGTYAFLIGIGKFSKNGFQLSQFFLREPIEEPAQLSAVLATLSDSQVLVTYNGKSFDVPLLNSRFITNGENAPLKSIAHIDLLHLARRLWRDRLHSRTLGSIEENILGAFRSGEDIPGWMVPTIYFDYLKTGDARPVSNVFYHNAMDILSLASLLNHISQLLENPHRGRVIHGIDLISLGKIYEDMGEFDLAAESYQRGLCEELPPNIRSQAIQRWSFMEKRRDNLDISMQLWQSAAEYEEIYAHVELAKIYEHRLRDFPQAIYWTEKAILVVQTQSTSKLDRSIWISQLEHRLSRLNRKSSA
jgi:uncharacterized protein YprB with RNaseH-like and TPR domain